MRIAYTWGMSAHEETERAVARWHEIVNAADLDAAREAVSDPIVVNGPKGAGPVSPAEFAEWITRSGIHLSPRSYHPVSEHVLVVEQDARWPQDGPATRVATVFRTHGGRVSAALRFPTLAEALEFAFLYREMAVTEPGTAA